MLGRSGSVLRDPFFEGAWQDETSSAEVGEGPAPLPRLGSASGIQRQKSTLSSRSARSAASGRSSAHLCDSRKLHRLSLERANVGKLGNLYIADLFHTLVNLPSHRFFLVFLSGYLSMYVGFAALYRLQPEICISEVHSFLHAIWFSVHTSATIGYGQMSPDPTCTGVNVIITAEVLTTCLVQASLLGVVFVRFSAAHKRSATIKFSEALAWSVGANGEGRFSFRLANLRKHQVVAPEVRLIYLRREDTGASEEDYVYSDLKLALLGGGTKVWLGVPSELVHVVDASSPLFGMDAEDIEAADAEFVAVLDGVDDSTSLPIQARHSYIPSDIRWHQRFRPVLHRKDSGILRVDFSSFDQTEAPVGEMDPLERLPA